MLANGPSGTVGWAYGCTVRCCGTAGPAGTLVPESICCWVGCADKKPTVFKACGNTTQSTMTHQWNKSKGRKNWMDNRSILWNIYWIQADTLPQAWKLLRHWLMKLSCHILLALLVLLDKVNKKAPTLDQDERYQPTRYSVKNLCRPTRIN